MKNKGHEHLFSHVKQKHNDFADQIYSSNSRLDLTIPEETKNLYGWLDWVIMTDQPISFVDYNLTQKKCKLTPITRPTFMNYLQILVKEVEKKIEWELPEKFGLILVGWSENGSGTHYVGIFAVYQSKEGQPETPLIAFSPLLDEIDFSAKSHKDFIEAFFTTFKGNITNVLFITSDNCSKNWNLAVLLGLPLVDCASHRFNLAVNTFLEDYSVMLDKVNNLMKNLSTLESRGSLRLLTPLAPITRKVTRCLRHT